MVRAYLEKNPERNMTAVLKYTELCLMTEGRDNLILLNSSDEGLDLRRSSQEADLESIE